MGKTQSKRSVDITTEGKKTLDEEITGKLEKIEDVDQRKQGNGDASQESLKTEKKLEVDESENDKDLTTEKCGDSQQNSEFVETTNNKHSNEVTENATEENVNVEEICPLSDESIKKSKKEKVKKKWSFRSLSFGKKDKQKPGKSDEEVLANGEMDKEIITSDPPIIGESVEETCSKIDTDTAVSENEIADQEKSTPTDESTDIVDPVTEEFTKTTVIENQTDETITTGNDEISSTAENIVTDVTSSVTKENGNEAEEVTIIANKSSSSSEFINEVVNNIIITDKDNGYNAEKSKDNAITEQQQSYSHIEVITDNGSEEHLKSDPIITNQIEENVVVNDNNDSNDIKNISENLSESLENSVQTGSHPPPLPCSPPPSQVSVFAFSDNNESETATDKIITEKIPSISPNNSQTNIEHNHTEQSTSVQKITKSEFKNEFNFEEQKISDDEELNSSIADAQNVKGEITAERATLEDLESPTENEETIAERVVQEITETAVEIIKDKNHEDNDISAVEKDTDEGENQQDVCINSPQTSSFHLITSDTNDTIPDNVTQCEIETILKQTEDCSIDKIAKLSLTEDDLTNDNDISKMFQIKEIFGNYLALVGKLANEEPTSLIADVQNEKGTNTDKMETLEDLESQIENDETIAERVVQEIRETAVDLLKYRKHEDKENGDDLHNDCIMSSHTASINLIRIIPDSVTHCEFETVLKRTETCSLDKISKLSLNEDDDLTNDNDISKEKTMEDKAPELTTPNPPVNCE